MIRTLATFLILVLYLSCSSSSKLNISAVRPEISPEIPITKLSEKGIAVIHPNYKNNYYSLMPYLFWNGDGNFNTIQGDFYNVKYGNNSDINIMTGFWGDYGVYKNALVILIALSNSSSEPINNISIAVQSSKNGEFNKRKPRYNDYNKLQQRVLFINELELANEYSILEKLEDDIITVKIGEQIYEFINPELELK